MSDSKIENLKTRDPFGDADIEGGAVGSSNAAFIHIRIQQRNGRKTLTTVQGLSDDYDKRKIARCCKKEFACNGTVVTHPEYGQVIQFQGDQRERVRDFLVNMGFSNKDQIKVHGF